MMGVQLAGHGALLAPGPEPTATSWKRTPACTCAARAVAPVAPLASRPRKASFPDPMARVTVEDCLEREENRFALVVLAAARTRQLMRGAEALVKTKNKPAVTSLREIAAGKVHFHRSSHEVVNEWVRQQHALQLAGR